MKESGSFDLKSKLPRMDHLMRKKPENTKQPAPLEAAEEAQSLGAKALQFAAQHKKGIGIFVVGAVIGLARRLIGG